MRRLAALVMLGAGPALAQDAPIPPPPVDVLPLAAPAAVLTVDTEVLFARSAWGRRLQETLDADTAALQAENDRLSDTLAAEEAALTARRSTLDAAAFRREAEAFDARATEVRRARAQAAADLAGRAEADRRAFSRAALPVINQLMQDRGAVAVLDQSTVVVSVSAIDITEALIARLDAELGDGTTPKAP